jgi:glycosyltransferase involved in cell wall biosynthesis
VHPQEEDFGITAVEAQAAGRPVIALGRGGALDTLRPLQPEGDASKATGICFEDPSARSLTDAVRRFEAVESRFDAGQIRAWAERFSPERFRAELQHQIEAAQRAPIR